MASISVIGPGAVGGTISLHADRLAGRRMEIDARNGAVVRLGAKHAIPTPVNAVLVDLLTTIEDAEHSRTARTLGS